MGISAKEVERKKGKNKNAKTERFLHSKRLT